MSPLAQVCNYYLPAGTVGVEGQAEKYCKQVAKVHALDTGHDGTFSLAGWACMTNRKLDAHVL
jgi:hypothetical protein